MEDLTLALITLTSFVLLFVVAIFADRAGLEGAEHAQNTSDASKEPIAVPVEDSPVLKSSLNDVSQADVA